MGIWDAADLRPVVGLVVVVVTVVGVGPLGHETNHDPPESERRLPSLLFFPPIYTNWVGTCPSRIY
jgi:hypothetical protein